MSMVARFGVVALLLLSLSACSEGMPGGADVIDDAGTRTDAGTDGGADGGADDGGYTLNLGDAGFDIVVAFDFADQVQGMAVDERDLSWIARDTGLGQSVTTVRRRAHSDGTVNVVGTGTHFISGFAMDERQIYWSASFSDAGIIAAPREGGGQTVVVDPSGTPQLFAAVGGKIFYRRTGGLLQSALPDGGGERDAGFDPPVDYADGHFYSGGGGYITRHPADGGASVVVASLGAVTVDALVAAPPRVFAAIDRAQSDGGSQMALIELPVDGGAPVEFTSRAKVGFGSHVESLSFDGRYLYWLTESRTENGNGVGDLYAFDTTSGAGGLFATNFIRPSTVAVVDSGVFVLFRGEPFCVGCPVAPKRGAIVRMHR